MKGFRLIAAFLALVLVASSVSFAASAAEINEDTEVSAAQEAVVKDEHLAETGAAATVKISSVTNTADGAKVSWKAVQGASSYVVYLYVGGGYSELTRTSELSCLHASISNAQTYHYNVRAIDADGNFITDFASSDFENTYYSAPVISSAASSYSGVLLNWADTDGISVYRLYRSVGSGSLSKLTDVVGTEYLDTTAVSGKKYTYALRCLSADGRSLVSDYSASTSVDYAQLPAVTSIVNTSTGAKITWTKPSSVNRVRLYYHNGSTWVRIAETTDTSYVHDNLTSGKKYRYTVRGVDNNGNFVTDFNNSGWVNMYIEPPAITSMTNTASGTVITWKAPVGAVRYRVFYKAESSGWKRLGDTDKTSYLAENASSGIKYTYTVRCINVDGSAYTSNYTSGKSITYIAVPQITALSNTATGTEITWTKPKGADRIRVYYRSNNAWVRLTETTDTKYVHDNLKAGTSYRYTLRCVDKAGNFISDFNQDGWSDTFFAPPVIKGLEVVNNGVKVTWVRTKGAQDYRLYRKSGTTSWTPIVTTDESSYIDKKVSSGVKYTYTLRMVTSDGDSFMSGHNGGKSITYLAVPQITGLNNTATGIEISWKMPKGADRIRVYYKGTNSWVRLTETADTKYVHDNLKAGKSYIYTLRCVDKDGNFISDFNQDGWSGTYFAPPVIKDFEATNEGINVTWTRVKGAEDYLLFRRTDGTSWQRIIATDKTSYVDKTVRTGVKYTYTLRMVKKDGVTYMSYHNSGKSITYSVIPSIKKIENTAEGAKITWDAAKGADYYRIYYKNSTGGWTRLASKYKLEYIDTSVKDGETRVYTIRCLNEKDEFVSGFNNTGWSNTFYAAPVITSVKYNNGSYTLSWKAKDGVDAYRVYRRTVGESFSRIVNSVAGSSFTDTTAVKGKVYAYTLRCLDAEGNVISGYVAKVKYYKNGKVVDGNISQGGTYGFKDGYLLTGLNRIGNRLYYYNDEGRMYSDTLIGNSSMGYYYVDPDGVCIESNEMRLAAEFMKKYCKGSTLKEKFKYGYLYIAHNFDYERRYTYPSAPSDLAEYATDMFTNHSGDCYRYAVCVAYLAKIAGYRTLVGVGEEDASGGDHGWTEVYVNGRWLICDAEAEIPKFGRDDYSEYMVTDSEHVWGVTADWYGELVLKDGKAVWKLF